MESSIALFVFAVLVFAAASSGAFFKPGPWYDRLRKPGWTPANWIFPVVWTPLYIMIAVAGWLVWREDPMHVALVFWVVQIVLNAVWSWFFFGRRQIGVAMIDVSLMWVANALFIAAAWPVSMLAALLFVPYLVWTSLAALLNWQVWRLNTMGASSTA